MFIGMVLYAITWLAMLWFIWLFYGALKSINKIDDKLEKIANNLDALDDIAVTIHQIHLSKNSPKAISLAKKNRIITHSEAALAEKELERNQTK